MAFHRNTSKEVVQTNIELAGFDVKRIESIQRLLCELSYSSEKASAEVVIGAALRVYEVELKREVKAKRGE